MASRFHLELALTPEGWRRDVVIRIDHGVISSVEDPDGRPAEHISGVVVPGLPNLHSHAFQRAMAGLTERRGSDVEFLLDLARGDVPLRRAAVAGRSRGDRRLRLHGDARGGLHAGGRVPLPASPARRQALRQRRRDVGAHRGGGRCGGHWSHPAAGALSPERFPGEAADAGAAPLRVRSRRLCAADGKPGARRQYRHRAPLAARRLAGRSAVGIAGLARPAGAYPRRRTDARGRGVPGRSRQGGRSICCSTRSRSRSARSMPVAGAWSMPRTQMPANWRASRKPMP